MKIALTFILIYMVDECIYKGKCWQIIHKEWKPCQNNFGTIPKNNRGRFRVETSNNYEDNYVYYFDIVPFSKSTPKISRYNPKHKNVSRLVEESLMIS